MNLSDLMTLADEYAAQNHPTQSILAKLAEESAPEWTEDERLNLGHAASFLDYASMYGVSDADDLLEKVQAALEEQTA